MIKDLLDICPCHEDDWNKDPEGDVYVEGVDKGVDTAFTKIGPANIFKAILLNASFILKKARNTKE